MTPDKPTPQSPVSIRPREPFSLSRTLRFILSPPNGSHELQFPPLLDYFVEGEYRRVLDLKGQHILYGVSEILPGAPVELQVRVLVGPKDPETLRAIRAQVERQFSTALDLSPFYDLARSDLVLRKLAQYFCGMRIPLSPSVYECLVSAVLEQQINLAFAHKVKRALIETHGTRAEFEGRRYNAFPEPAALAIATPRDLRRLQISGPKARYIIAISRAALDGSLDLEGLRSVEPSVAYARLAQWKGVGPWTTQYVGLRALGHLDSLPAADVGLQKAIQYFYGLRKQPSAAGVEKLARDWSGWRSYATFYLWLTFWEDSAWKEKVRGEIRSERRSRAAAKAGRQSVAHDRERTKKQ